MSAFAALRQPTQGASAAETVIGRTAQLDGRLRAESTVRVRGSVQGELTSTETIVVEEHGRVSASVTALQVIVAGQVEGQLHGTGRVELRATARVRGEIHTRRLVIHEGAGFEGRVSMNEMAAGTATVPGRSGATGPGEAVTAGQASAPAVDRHATESAKPD